MGVLTSIETFVTTVASERVKCSTYDTRMATCMRCERMRRSDGQHYCRSCGCPEWKYASLESKNRKAGWQCPLGKHKE